MILDREQDTKTEQTRTTTQLRWHIGSRGYGLPQDMIQSLLDGLEIGLTKPSLAKRKLVRVQMIVKRVGRIHEDHSDMNDTH